MAKVAVDRVSLGLSITAISYILSYYIESAEIRQHIYFIGQAVGLFVASLGLQKNVLRDILTGFSFGRLYDEFYFFVLGNEETLLSYSICFVVLFPLVGYSWRRWRNKTGKVIALSVVGKFLIWLGAKLMDLLF